MWNWTIKWWRGKFWLTWSRISSPGQWLPEQEDLQGTKVPSPWNENLFKRKSCTVTRLRSSTLWQLRAVCMQASMSRHKSSNHVFDYISVKPYRKQLEETGEEDGIPQADNQRQVNIIYTGTWMLHLQCTQISTVTQEPPSRWNNEQYVRSLRNEAWIHKAPVVAADEVASPMLWTALFLEAQGYSIRDNIIYQDNRSVMLLETNRRKSAGKISMHLNKNFFVADQKAKEERRLSISYGPTDSIFGNCMMKPDTWIQV